MFSLTLYKSVELRAYTVFRSTFPQLPSVTKLHDVLNEIPLSPGLNPFIKNVLSMKAANIRNKKEKVCVLLWNEVSLQPHVTYIKSSDVICGLEDWGTRSPKLADHAITFMLRGIHSGRKMPISYGFCDMQTKTPLLAKLIEKHTEVITNARISVIGIFFTSRHFFSIFTK